MTSTDSNNPDDAPRRFLPTALKIIAAHIILIFAILIPLVIHENRQAERDWNEFKTHWEAKGEIFDINKLIPPKIPDEENFAAAPIIAELFDEHSESRISHLEFHDFEEFEKIRRPSNFELDNRQAALGASTPQLKDYLVSNDETLSEQQAAERILNILEPYTPTLNEITSASQKPGVSYPFDFESITFETPFSHLKGILTAAKAFHLRTRSHLALQQPEDAIKGIVTILRLAEMSGTDPVIISHLVEFTIYNMALQLIWEALETEQFSTTNDLILIKNILAKINLEQRFCRAIRIERALFLTSLEGILDPSKNFLTSEPKLRNMTLFFRFAGMYKAFKYRNKMTYCQFAQDHYLSTTAGMESGRIDIDEIEKIDGDLLALGSSIIFPVNPYAMLTIETGSAFKVIAERTLQTATRIDLAQIAIALELYRREHGEYPDTLSPLAPNYIDVIPLDLITGDPLHYRIKADGTPFIYSVGLNKIDENGLLKRKRKLGDWVWQYTLPDDFDEADWRK